MSDTPLMHWECPACEFDDSEAGYLLPDGDHWCPLCDMDTGRSTLLRMIRIHEENSSVKRTDEHE